MEKALEIPAHRTQNLMVYSGKANAYWTDSDLGDHKIMIIKVCFDTRFQQSEITPK